jgi:hypothetical protein
MRQRSAQRIRLRDGETGMRVFMFLLAAALLTSGAMLVHASAKTIENEAKPGVQQMHDQPAPVKPKVKLYA